MEHNRYTRFRAIKMWTLGGNMFKAGFCPLNWSACKQGTTSWYLVHCMYFGTNEVHPFFKRSIQPPFCFPIFWYCEVFGHTKCGDGRAERYSSSFISGSWLVCWRICDGRAALWRQNLWEVLKNRSIVWWVLYWYTYMNTMLLYIIMFLPGCPRTYYKHIGYISWNSTR